MKRTLRVDKKGWYRLTVASMGSEEPALFRLSDSELGYDIFLQLKPRRNSTRLVYLLPQLVYEYSLVGSDQVATCSVELGKASSIDAYASISLRARNLLRNWKGNSVGYVFLSVVWSAFLSKKRLHQVFGAVCEQTYKLNKDLVAEQWWLKNIDNRTYHSYLLNRHSERVAVTTNDPNTQLPAEHRSKVNWPKVTVIIPTRNQLDLIDRCIKTLLDITDYPEFELIVVDNQSDCPDTIDYLSRLHRSDKPVKVVEWNREFNYAGINNFAVGQSTGSVLALLNNDIEVIHDDWLKAMVFQVLRPEIGCVGAKLLYSNKRIQHAGVFLGIGGIAGHLDRFQKDDIETSNGRLQQLQYVSAVTGACLVINKDLYLNVGGMNADNLPINYNDVDLCLRLAELGYKHLWTPEATLIHHESMSRGKNRTKQQRRKARKEERYMRKKWGPLLDNDPYYDKRLTLIYEDGSFRSDEAL